MYSRFRSGWMLFKTYNRGPILPLIKWEQTKHNNIYTDINTIQTILVLPVDALISPAKQSYKVKSRNFSFCLEV